MKALSHRTSWLTFLGVVTTGLWTLFPSPSHGITQINPLPSGVLLNEVALSRGSKSTIFDIASYSSNFDILETAIRAAGLVNVLDARGSLTLFAPTDSAFSALPNRTLQRLLRPENKQVLRDILTYHVLSGERRSNRLRSGRVETLEGSDVRIRIRDGRIRVNDAAVLRTDVSASNGVVHVIDEVLIPPGLL